MKRATSLVCILFALAGPVLAQAGGVDWKFYGGARIADEDSLCFFDAKGVNPLPENHVRVWVKCVLASDMDKIDVAKDFNGKIMEDAAQKVAHSYMPPIATVQDIDFNKSIAITTYEVIANKGYVQPQAKILYELDCSRLMLRELSLYIETGGKAGSIRKPRDWSYIPPESNGANLSKILCRAR